MEIIKTENLVFEYKSYNDENGSGQSLRALNGINIQIRKGEFVAILGHNGSGKSTLAKHMNALLTPTEGTIWIKGYNSQHEENIWKIRQSAGMVFQNPDNQIIATIVEEDVAFGLENLGVAPDQIRARVNQALESVSMQDYAEVSPHFLSGGQKQRIAIAGVIAMKPDCIVLDEATAMLDPSGRRDVMRTITDLNQSEGITIVHITHFMEEAVLAKRVIVMEEGKVVMDGSPREVFTQVELLKNIGLDVPQVTELAHQLRQRGLPMDLALTIPEFLENFSKLQAANKRNVKD